MHVRFLRLHYFLWVLVPVGLWFVYITYGLPHMLWSYSWRDDGQGHDPMAERYYTRCTYVGPYGNQTILPRNGKCPFLRFEKKAGSH